MSSRFAKRSSARHRPGDHHAPAADDQRAFGREDRVKRGLRRTGLRRLRIGGVMAELAIRPDIGGIDVVVLDIVRAARDATSRDAPWSWRETLRASCAECVSALRITVFHLVRGRISAS